MKKKEKLQLILNKLNSIDKSVNDLPNDEIISVTERLINEESSNLFSRMKDNSSVKALQKVSASLANFKKEFNVKSLMSDLSKFQGEVKDNQKSITDNFDSKINDLKKTLISVKENSLEKGDIKDWSETIESFQKDLSTMVSVIDSSEKEKRELKKDIKNLGNYFEEMFKSSLEESDEKLKDIDSKIEETRKDFLSRISRINQGGGSANQKISINGTVMSTKFTDFNLKGTGITKADNATTKQVDITLSAENGITIGTTPIIGGADTEVLFNDNGVVGSEAAFTYDKTTDVMRLGGIDSSSSSDDDFTIAVIPDSQYEVLNENDMWFDQMNYIVAQKTAQNIQLVLHEGDITDTATQAEWDVANDGFDLLDAANIPYVTCIGNHDYTTITTRTATTFNTYFGNTRLAANGYDGHYSSDYLNYYSSYTIGSETFLILSLEFFPRAAVLSWAQGIVAANPDKKVIVLTHGHIDITGQLAAEYATYGPNPYTLSSDYTTSSSLWTNLVGKYENVFMVLNGHFISSPYTMRLTAVGQNGNTVHQVFTNYQSNNSGYGYLLMMKFQPSTKKILMTFYSATTGANDPANAPYEISYDEVEFNANEKATGSIFAQDSIRTRQNLYADGQFIVANAFRTYQGAVDGNRSFADFRSNLGSANFIVSAPTTGSIYLNFDHGTGGTVFGSGASLVTAGFNANGGLNMHVSGGTPNNAINWGVFSGTPNSWSSDTSLKRQAAGVLRLEAGLATGVNGNLSIAKLSSDSPYNDINKDLQIHIPFTETTGTTLLDRGPNYLTATAIANSVTPGKFGNCISLNGTNQWAQVLSTSAISGPSAMTASIWFKTSTSVGAQKILMGKHAGGTSGEWFLSANNNTRFQFTNINSALTRRDALFDAPASISDGNWHLATITHDGTARVYIDGVEATYVSGTQTNTMPFQTTAIEITIGTYQAHQLLWAGELDEFKFWTRALTAFEIRRLYEEGNGTSAPYLSAFNGNLGLGVTSPTATLHLKAGTATASTAPLKFNSGTLLTASEAGAVEFLTDKAYLTITTGAARKEVALNDATLVAGRVPYTTTNGRLTSSANILWDSSSEMLTITNNNEQTSLKLIDGSSGKYMLLGYSGGTGEISFISDSGLIVIGDGATNEGRLYIVNSGGGAAVDLDSNGNSTFVFDVNVPDEAYGSAWDGSLEVPTKNAIYDKLQTLTGVLFTQTADKTVANTTTETSIVGTGVGSLTLPANFLIAGRTIRIRISGVYSTVAVTGDTVTIKVKYGSTVIVSKATSGLLTGATNLSWWGEIDVTCRTTGATGTVQPGGSVRYQISSVGGVAEDDLNNGAATTTIDTTASGLIDVTVTHSAANASNSIKSLVATFEVLN